ncbi:MAG: response regulator [Anaerolineales bacterium]|uniref:histidine kinase n=1 Tax=Candidatus Desulfolinea nitratireducens TaxID=2841698 RepID=A0A8J6NLN0_9CHLR|nr:response regulator [Candidatus Desulfolinea nitratireducens]MBL6959770.1 response regulator [Anaerolineales bacterium]
MSGPFVLIVDDEPGIAKLCERLLTRAGFRTLAFTDPQKAMAQLRGERVDLLLVDIRMPEIDGFGVVAYAKEQQPDIATLIMTGFGTVETAIKALRQGVDGLILKPFEESKELVDAVKQALSDNQRKRDAAHTEALRPLFDVTKAFLAETRPDRLPELIVEAICNQMRCEQAAYYQYAPESGVLTLLSKRGQAFPENDGETAWEAVTKISETGLPVTVTETETEHPSLQKKLVNLGVGSALFVPISHSGVHALLYAGREIAQAAFREIDLDTFLILAQQASVAVENATLYAELREYVQQVEDSQKALLQAEKMATAGRLTASIAHEINNPLQAVRNCLHLAGREDLPDEKRKEYLTLAQNELDRLSMTVQRMLDFYRPGIVSPKKVDLPDILNHVLGLMDTQLQKKNIIVSQAFPKHLPLVMAVGAQLQQVFLNLILNAYDAMDSGGRIEISARRRKDTVDIIFQDSGSGIAPRDQASIFEPFISNKEGGTGLGLTVSYNIITALGGELEFIPNDQSGACFQVTLPIGDK